MLQACECEAFWFILEGCLFLLLIYGMCNLNEIQEETNQLVEELVGGTVNQLEDFFKSVSEGFEKFFLH